MTETDARRILEKRVRAAHWRLNAISLAGCWLRTLFYLAAAATLALLALKWTPWTVPALELAAWGLGLSVPASLAWFWRSRHTRRAAAILVDRRLNLKDKISSALEFSSLTPATPNEAEWRRKQILDACEPARRIDLARAFPWKAPAEAQWLWAPLAAMVLVAYAIPQWQIAAGGGRGAARAAEIDQAALEREAKALTQRRLTLEQRAEAQRMEAAAEMSREIQELAEELAKGRLEQREALSKITSLEQTWERRREQLEEMERLTGKPLPLNRLKTAGALAQSIQNGDYEQAAEELQNLQKQLKMGGPGEEGQKRLAAELKQIAAALAADLPLTKALGAAARELEAGDLENALEGIRVSEDSLKDLENMLDQIALLEEALKDLQQAKLGLLGKCKNCGGDCPGGQCQGLGRGQGTGPFREGATERTGNGMGGPNTGRGGRAQFEETETGLKSAKLEGELHNAPPSGLLEARGMPFESGSEREAGAAELGTVRAREDALTRERVPVPYRDHVHAYFNSIGGTNSQTE